MIAIDNNPHDAMKTERCVSILKKIPQFNTFHDIYFTTSKHPLSLFHRRNEVLNCIAQGQNNRIKQC